MDLNAIRCQDETGWYSKCNLPSLTVLLCHENQQSTYDTYMPAGSCASAVIELLLGLGDVGQPMETKKTKGEPETVRLQGEVKGFLKHARKNMRDKMLITNGENAEGHHVPFPHTNPTQKKGNHDAATLHQSTYPSPVGTCDSENIS